MNFDIEELRLKLSDILTVEKNFNNPLLQYIIVTSMMPANESLFVSAAIASQENIEQALDLLIEKVELFNNTQKTAIAALVNNPISLNAPTEIFKPFEPNLSFIIEKIEDAIADKTVSSPITFLLSKLTSDEAINISLDIIAGNNQNTNLDTLIEVYQKLPPVEQLVFFNLVGGSEIKSLLEQDIDQKLKVDYRNSILGVGKRNNDDSRTSFNDQWKVTSLGDMLGMSNQFKSFQDSLESTSAALESISDTLDAAQAFVGILEELESAISDPIAELSKSIIDQIQSITYNARSTGLYMLDMFQHYFAGENFYGPIARAFEKPLNVDDSTTPFSESGESRVESYLRDNQLNYDYVVLEGNTLDDPDQAARRRSAQTLVDQGIAYLPTFNYKPTTFNEFLETVADAFLDPNDIPHGAIASGKVMFRNPPTEVEQAAQYNQRLGELANSGEPFSPINLKILNESFETGEISTLLRPGRPNLSDGTRADVYIIIITAPNLRQFFKQISLFSKLFSGIFLTFGRDNELFKGQENEFVEDAFTDLLGSAKDIYNNIADLGSTIRLQNLTNPINEGTAPDFYGISVYSLFPGLFNRIDSLLNSLRDLLENPGSTFSELINAVIEALQRKIEKLERIVKNIDEIIKFLDDFANAGIRILSFSTVKGSYDIYERILNSNFEQIPEATNGRIVYIGGYVLCSAAITSGTVKAGLNEYYQNRNIRIDEVTGEIESLKDRYPGGAGFLSRIIKS